MWLLIFICLLLASGAKSFYEFLQNDKARRQSFHTGEIVSGYTKDYYLGNAVKYWSKMGHDVLIDEHFNVVRDFYVDRILKKQEEDKIKFNECIEKAKKNNKAYFDWYSDMRHSFGRSHPSGNYELKTLKRFYTYTKNNKHYKYYDKTIYKDVFEKYDRYIPDIDNLIEISEVEWISYDGHRNDKFPISHSGDWANKLNKYDCVD